MVLGLSVWACVSYGAACGVVVGWSGQGGRRGRVWMVDTCYTHRGGSTGVTGGVVRTLCWTDQYIAGSWYMQMLLPSTDINGPPEPCLAPPA